MKIEEVNILVLGAENVGKSGKIVNFVSLKIISYIIAPQCLLFIYFSFVVIEIHLANVW